MNYFSDDVYIYIKIFYLKLLNNDSLQKAITESKLLVGIVQFTCLFETKKPHMK